MKLLTELDSLDNVKDGETRILPTKVSQLQNDSGYTTNKGTITGVSVNSTSVATSGVANITSIPASILTGAIPSAVTATTQSSGDSSAKIATTAFVTTAISALPAALNNIKDGSQTGSIRTTGSTAESSSYTIGPYAFAEGSQTKASGRASHAEGWATEATAFYAHSEGFYTTASYSSSHAEGNYTKAGGSASHAEGYYTVASGSSSHAEGSYTIAKGGHAEGENTLAWFSGCHAEGTTDNTTISGTITAIDQENLKVTVSGFSSSNNLIYQLYNHSGTTFYGDQYITNAQWSSNQYILTLSKWDSSLAVNGTFYVKFRTMSTDTGAHAEGAGTKAGSRASHAEGIGTITSSYGQHAEGKWNVANSNYLHIAGNGTADNARSNAYTLDWDGNGVFAGKVTVGAAPTNNMDVATKQYADSVGISGLNIKNGSASNSLRTSGSGIENSSDYTIGQYAFAEGGSTKASGKYSHAEGYSGQSIGEASHAEGYGTKATATASHAEGEYTVANQLYSHAEGYLTSAGGYGSHAEGYFIEYGSGTITSLDQENLKIVVSGLLPTFNYKNFYFYKTNSISTSNWITNSSYNYSTNLHTLTINSWDSDICVVDGPIYLYSGPIVGAMSSGSHAEGRGTVIDGYINGAHAEGIGTWANSSGQHVQGKWNLSGNYADIVGNGTDNMNRSNAYTLDWNGNGVYAGKLTVGTGPSNNLDVATKKYVDDSDTKNTAGSTDTSSKIYLIGATSQAANPQTYSDNEVYATSGVLTTKSVQVGGTAATMQYNSTDKCIEFVFA